MKKHLVFSFVTISLLMASCSEKFEAEQIDAQESEKYVTFSIDVSRDTTNVALKTSLDTATGYVKWSPEDYLTVYFQGVTVSPVRTSTAQNIRNNGQSATFTYQVPEGDYKKAYNADKILYYGSQELTVDKDYKPTSIKLNACQEYAGAKGFSEFENISLGFLKKGSTDFHVLQDSVCVMKNLFGILRVKIQLNDVSKEIDYVQLTDNTTGNYLAGEFTIGNLPDFDHPDNNPTLAHKAGSGGESRTIEKKVPRNVTVTGVGNYFYFLVPPGTLLGNSNGFNLKVYTRDGYYDGKKIKVTNGKIERSVVTTVNIKTFTPKPIPTPPQPTANCYIVPATAGTYSIPAEYEGNAFQGNGDDIIAKTHQITGGSYAEILWQTRNNGAKMSGTEVVCCPLYFESTTDHKHYISFERSGIEGNALVALKSADGTILWSWHLWVTSPEDSTTISSGIELNNGAGYIMDRNIGALSIDLNDGTQTHGLHYQYGRKDPFMGSQKVVLPNAGSSYDDYMEMWPYQAIGLSNQYLTIAESVKKPNIRVTAGQNTWSSEEISWGKSKGDSLSTSPKTLYDPCPVGWRTIEEAVFTKALYDTVAQKFVLTGDVIDATEGAFAFKLRSASASPILFPATGYSPSNNSLMQVGQNVYLWGATSNKPIVGKLTTQAYHLMLTINSNRSYEGSFPVGNMCFSMPVRCVKWNEPATPTN